MKKLLSILCVVMLFASSCTGANGTGGYVINGTIKDAPNEEVYFDFLTMETAQTLDTVKTDAAGKFTFKGVVKEYGICRVRLANQSNWLMMVDNKSKITFQASKPDMLHYTLTGGTGNDEFLKVLVKAATIQQVIGAKNQEYNNLYNSGNQIAAAALRDSMTTMINAFEKDVKQMADATPNALLAMYEASFINTEQDLPFGRRVLEKMEKTAPQSVYTAQYKKRFLDMEAQVNQQKMQEEMAKKTAIGSVAPDIKLPTPDGKELALSSLRGKVVLLDFWASWCGPCRRENPNVVRIYNTYKDKGFTVFSVSFDKSADPWKAAIAQDGLIWPNHVSDLKGWGSIAAGLYGINSIPRTFLIDKDGKILATNLRGEELEQKVKEILEKH
jgi:alkyl hydroperoxide reductase subunit AhpC